VTAAKSPKPVETKHQGGDAMRGRRRFLQFAALVVLSGSVASCCAATPVVVRPQHANDLGSTHIAVLSVTSCEGLPGGTVAEVRTQRQGCTFGRHA